MPVPFEPFKLSNGSKSATNCLHEADFKRLRNVCEIHQNFLHNFSENLTTTVKPFSMADAYESVNSFQR
jgi:hypothetical protein